MGNQVKWSQLENGQLDLRLVKSKKEFVGDGPIPLQVSHSLVDLIPSWSWPGSNLEPWTPQCGLIGTVAESKSGDLKGKTVFGIGKAADRINVEQDQIISVFDGKNKELYLYLTLFMRLIGILKQSRISLAERTLITGGGLMGKLASQLAYIVGSSSLEFRDPKKFRSDGLWMDSRINDESRTRTYIQAQYDLLIDTSGNLDWVHTYASELKSGGRIALVADTYTPRLYNFYENVHLKSLKMLGCNSNNNKDRIDDLEFLLHQYSIGRLTIPINSVRSIKIADIHERKETEGIIIDWRQ
jgi:D-arabinose 1-dehydrogenase-like Zn-dependent alcohol dehydrogenase|tara:strand:- start:3186 stop:4082 length:897 start_codon:yes stop_codon:yes gene_type:complete